MAMHVLVVGPEEKEAAHLLCEFAARPENHYRPGPNAKIPGDDPRHVLQFGDFRCVFSFTLIDGLWRHLSVSVSDRTKMPHPAMAEEIGHLFGFQGPLRDWAVNPIIKEGVVVMAQKV